MQTLMPITCLMGQLYAQQRAAQGWLVAQGIDRAVAAKYVGGIYSTITHDSAAPGPVSWSRVPALSPPTVAARCGLPLQASQTPPPHTQDTLDHLVAEQTPGGLNEQVPSLDSRRVHRWGYGSLVACDECVLLCLQCVLLCFRRCSASSPKQGRTRPSPTRLTALLRAFSNGKRQSSRKSPTLQRPIEVAIDCSEHRALQTVLRLAGVRSCMRAAWLHSGCGSRELRGDSVEDERLSLKVSG